MTDAPKPSSQTMLQNAQELWKAGRVDEAMAAFESLVQTEPNNVRLLVEFAQMLGQTYNIERADQLLEHAQKVAPEDGTILAAIANAYRQLFRPEKAIAIYEHLREEQKLSLPHLGQLATLYERTNQRDEALDAIRVCVEQAPSQPEPKVLLARLQRQAGELDAAEQLLGTLVSSNAPATVLIHGWSELALVRDQQDDFGGAVEAIEKAKSMLRQLPESEKQSKRSLAINQAFAKLYSQVNQQAIASWSNERLESHHCAGVAHLLGFPRSGTTLLEQVLDCHPQLRSASERAVFTKAIFPQMCQLGDQQELTFAAINSCSTERINRLRRRYLQAHEAIAGASLNGLVHLDKNPNHTSLLVGLYRLFPESRFVFALRDPRDVIVSTYMRYFSLSEFSASYLTWGSTCALYAHEMNVWMRMRSLLPKNWIEIKYEDTVADLEQTARDVISFLGLSWDDRVMKYREHSSRKLVNSPTHAEVRKPVYQSSVGRWKNYEPQLGPYLSRLEHYVKAFGYD